MKGSLRSFRFNCKIGRPILCNHLYPIVGYSFLSYRGYSLIYATADFLDNVRLGISKPQMRFVYQLVNLIEKQRLYL